MENNNSENAALIETLKEHIQVKTFTAVNPGLGDSDGVTLIAAPKGFELRSIKPYLDEYLTKPERIKGISYHTSLDSFLMHVQAFKDTQRSAVFADVDNSTLQCVYDYNSRDDARFCDHRAVYTAKVSKPWKRWTAGSGQPFNQAEFANFIENNALDLIDPPTDVGGEGDAAILNIAKTLNTTLASASKVIELARGISIHEASTAKSNYSTGSGEVVLEYVTEHKDGTGAKLKVPGLFVIAIPVYEDGHSYRVVVRLRYRLKEGVVTWFYELYQPEKCVEDAFNELCTETQGDSLLPVYRGKPEQIRS